MELQLKQMLMSAVEMRQEVHQMVDQIDEQFLKAVHALMGTYTEQIEDPIVGYEIDGTAVHASVARKQFEASIEAAKHGEYITLEDLEKEVETW